MSEEPAVPILSPAVEFVGACPEFEDEGPEKPRNERGGGMRGPVLLLFLPCVKGGPPPPIICPRSENRGTTGGSAASIESSFL